ncbi:PstS family phosphate ABC transporter substrate-binding protein [Pararhizobium sp. IMCC21322]|uniref:PstS family phosphate ABC transporter substrate-binding protein n=1 Tax=Pararhizobium sp. IMCC21322 TaxID=3067903 RepID=UPI002740907B|nr:substrate-binding domain-containing protein [Pararhizobium sp. IMCC21322]
MKTVSAICAIIVGASFLAIGGSAKARDQIQISGSSTVLPYANIVAEAFGNSFYFPSPKVGSGGSTAGLKQFCEGVGENTIDIANSSRSINKKELEACRATGFRDVHQVKFGYDGIVFAYNIFAPSMAFEPAHWYKALAARIVVGGKLVDNPYMTWNEVNPKFPAMEITAYIPGKKHGTREVFEEKVLAAGCEATGALEVMIASGMDPIVAEGVCIEVREDGRSVDIDGDYTETLDRINLNKSGIGVFGLAFYKDHANKLQVSTMGGILPSTQSISRGEYPVSRPLYFYIKQKNIGVIPGLAEYVEFFLSEEISGPYGPLADYGLVSLPEFEREQEITQFQNKKTM